MLEHHCGLSEGWYDKKQTVWFDELSLGKEDARGWNIIMIHNAGYNNKLFQEKFNKSI